MLALRLFSKVTRTNAATATHQLLHLLQVPVTASTVTEALEFHPDGDSLYSISDSLRRWGVDSMALQVDKAHLSQLPVPFVAYSSEKGGRFKVVSKVEQNNVLVVNEKGQLERGDRAAFEKEWNGIALLAERNERSGEPAYASNRMRERGQNLRIPFFILALFVLSVCALVVAAPLPLAMLSGILLLLKLSGVVVTGLLLWFEIDGANPALQQVCSGSAKANCAAVLQGKAAKLFNRISWSEVGFGYFAGGLLFLLFGAAQQPALITALAWLNMLALPYTLYSVLYQWRVAKQWCPLCLAVQALLVLEAAAFYFLYLAVVGFSAVPAAALPVLLSSFTLPVLFWFFVKPFFKQAQQTRELRRSLARIKYHPEVFSALLSRQKQVSISFEGLGITLGNQDAAHTVIKVCNPYCGPCAKAHPVIDALLESNQDVKVQIIFTATATEKDYRAQPVRHFLALQECGKGKLLQQALDDWYGAKEKSYEAFAAQYPLPAAMLEKQTPKLAAMEEWCSKMEIAFTPTFFVDGHQLPEFFRPEDLQHLLH